MKKATGITCLFVDIGGVLLSDGWYNKARRRAAAHFKLEWNDMEARHQLNFSTFEEGKISLDEYLSRVVFYEKRAFTKAQFRNFLFSQSTPFPAMINLIIQLKVKYGLKIVVVSNEAREINEYRIKTFKLNHFVDFFVSSCFVGMRKPDEDIFRLALDMAQVPAEKVVYLENTAMFVQVAAGLGIKGILHTDYESTVEQFASFGLQVDTTEE